MGSSGRKNVLRIPYRRLKAGFSVCWLGLFVAGVLSEMHEVRTFAPCVKHFNLTCLLFFHRLKITLDSEQPMLKEKRIIPSVWGGIKDFEHFLRGKCFSDCASDWFMSWFRQVELKHACILLLVVTVTFITCPDLLPLQNQPYLCLQSKNHIAVITH